MSIPQAVRDAVQKTIHHDCFEVAEHGEAITVFEKTPSGACSLRLQPHPAHGLLRLKLDGDKAFGFFKEKAHCDGYVLEKHADDTWSAHLIECKRKLSSNALNKADKQLQAGFHRLHMLAAWLGVTPASWHAWVAYRSESVSPDANPDPILYKSEITDDGSAAPSNPTLALWNGERGIELGPASSPLGRIPLDPNGNTDQAFP